MCAFHAIRGEHHNVCVPLSQIVLLIGKDGVDDGVARHDPSGNRRRPGLRQSDVAYSMRSKE